MLSRLIILIFSMGLLYSCSLSDSPDMQTEKLGVRFSDDGKIIGAWIGENNPEKKVVALTEIEGCHPIGKATIRELDNGAFIFTRTLRNDSIDAECTVTDRFSPAKNSIRWDVEISGTGRPWSAAIKTVFHYPVGKETRFWTTWGRPKYYSSGDSSLDKSLTPVPGASPEGAILIKSNKDWVDPLVPVPFVDDTLFYGAPPPFSYNRSLVSAEWTFFREIFSVPVFSILENKETSGLGLALSPEDNILSLQMITKADGSITYRRLFNKISKNNTVKFSMDIFGDTSDWRCALGWMSTRYPDYFNPKNPGALQLNGTGAYSNFYDSFDVKAMKDMDFTVNWQASFDFPYMGMFLPPVKRDVEWTRFGKGKMSISRMNDYAGSMRKNGFYVLNYFNVTEFGTQIQYPYNPKKSADDPDLWQNPNEFLFTRFPKAVLQYTDPFDSSTRNGRPFHTWGNALVLDCGDSSYRQFLLQQAKRHVTEIPNAFGICIDRLDWLNIFNIDADDGVSWFNEKPARSMSISYKNLMEELGPIMHNAGKFILANAIGRCIDYFKHLDGAFDEFTYSGTPLNTTAFICLNKPALGWTDDKKTVLNEGGDRFFQKYLYMGVFPMCPFPGNDHSLESSDSVKQLYRDYGPLMKLIKERKWVLSPHPVSVEGADAKANIFSTPQGYFIPVVYGREKKVRVSISAAIIPEKFQCFVYYPGTEKPVELTGKKEKGRIIVDVRLIRGCGMLQVKSI